MTLLLPKGCACIPFQECFLQFCIALEGKYLYSEGRIAQESPPGLASCGKAPCSMQVHGVPVNDFRPFRLPVRILYRMSAEKFDLSAQPKRESVADRFREDSPPSGTPQSPGVQGAPMPPGAPGQTAPPPQEGPISPDQLPVPSSVDFTPPIIQSAVTLFTLHGLSVSPRNMAAALPKISGFVHPTACARAAKEFGLDMTVARRNSIDAISPLSLPCMLIFDGERTCVLTSYNDSHAEIITPETGKLTQTVSRELLDREFGGIIMLAKPSAQFERRIRSFQLLESKRWFWGTLSHFLPIYRHVLCGSALVNVLALSSPLFFMTIYDRVVPNNAINSLWYLAIGLFIAYFFDFLLKNLRCYFVDAAGRKADLILASRIMQQLLSMRLEEKPDSAGAIANNLRELETLCEFFGSVILLAIVDVPFLFLFVGVIFLVCGPLGFVPLVAVPFVIGVGVFLQFPLQRMAEDLFKESMQKNAMLFEAVNGLETIKATGAETRIQKAWEKMVGMNAFSNAKAKQLANLASFFSIFSTQVVSIAIVVWGVYRVSDGHMSFGGLIASSMLAARAMMPLTQIASLLTRLQQSRMALKALDVLMNKELEKKSDREYVEFGYLEPAIDFENVSFKYPSASLFSIESISLRIAPGSRIGIVGRMGSGKTTLGRLCVGFYEPTEGTVKFGGVDLRQLDMVTLRSRIGYVSQDTYLFQGTVRENIAFGSLECDESMLLRAASIAGVTDFVSRHPDGFNMPIAERGMNLSGGQRQAIAIARALLPDPEVLILDEPSSNMDTASERALQQRISLLASNGKTLILITHRLSLLALVNTVVVMRDGKIANVGPKEKFMKAAPEQAKKQAGPAQANTASAG
jgi:type I secretion system ATPase, LssB family